MTQKPSKTWWLGFGVQRLGRTVTMGEGYFHRWLLKAETSDHGDVGRLSGLLGGKLDVRVLGQLFG